MSDPHAPKSTAKKPIKAPKIARPRGRPPKSAARHEPEVADLPDDAPADAPSEAMRPGQIPADPVFVVPTDKRVVIGITGEPGAGKSALARQLNALGGTIVDVDKLGHELIETPAMKRALVQGFGNGILTSDGGINRRELASLAFATPDDTARLNAIVHPKLTVQAKALIATAGNFVVIDAGLLHELGLASLCTITLYVKANREVRLTRVGERGWDDVELARRDTALGNPDERRKRCQMAVDNSGDPALLTAYAKHILARQIGLDPAMLKKAAGAAKPVKDEAKDDRRDDDEDAAEDTTDESASDASGGDENETDAGPVIAETHRVEILRQEQPRQQHQQRQHPNQPGNQPQGGSSQGNNQGNNQGFDANRPVVKVDLNDYLKRTLPDLQAEAEKFDVRDVKWLKKHDLICEILRRVAGGRQDEIIVDGYMEIAKEQGYIRSNLNGYLAVPTDTYVPIQQQRRYGLKAGMHVTGTARAPRGNEKCPQLLAIHTVMGEPENKRTAVQEFEHLVPLHAFERLFMEIPSDPTDYSLRIIDLIAPIGKGQRGLLVAQPKCGKTVYLTKIAKAITTNNPECVLMVLLVDERPEEVTDMQRGVKGEVIASTFDQHSSRHVQCAEMTINKAKRLVERGKDVVILLDSITRLARAYNAEAPGSGRIMSGGIESTALIKPKQFFGAARKIEGGGSLTILATALVDTGSLADTVIFEEFKGTGNMELVLDRRLADRRVFPALNIPASGTRKDDLLIKSDDELKRVWALRRFLADRSPQDAVEFCKSKLSKYKTNIEFLLSMDPDKMNSW